MIHEVNWLRSHGIMPEPGGRNAQDPRFIDAVNILESSLSGTAQAMEKIEQKKIERENKKLVARAKRGRR